MAQASPKPVFPIVEKSVVLFLMVLCAGVVFYQTGRAAPLVDITYVLDHAYCISQGEIPYKDFDLWVAPGTYLIQALVIKLFGVALIHHIVYCAVLSALTFLLTYVLLCFLQENRILNLALALPIAISGGYGIYSYPNYDIDCTFWILAALTFLLWSREKGYPPVMMFLSGFLAFVPPLFKQNTGLVYFGLIHGTLLLSLVILKPKTWFKPYQWFLIGSTLSVLAVLAAVYFTCGFGNIFYWLFAFPSQHRLPDLHGFLSLYSLYWDKTVYLWITFWVEAYLIGRHSFGKNRVVSLAAILLFMAPSFLIPLIWPLWYEAGNIWLKSDYYFRTMEIWPITLLVTGFLAFIMLFLRPQERTFEKFLALSLFGVINASFLTHGIFGSTFGIGPLLSVLLGLLYILTTQTGKEFGLPNLVEKGPLLSDPFRIMFLFLGIILAVNTAIYVKSNLALRCYVELSGPLQNAALPPLRGLNSPGPWIPEMEQFLEFAQKEIPPEASLLLLPWEDPYYFTLQRHHLFPLMIGMQTVYLKRPEELEEILVKHPVDWIAEKIHLQNDFGYNGVQCVLGRLIKNYKLYKRLDGYLIFKRDIKPS